MNWSDLLFHQSKGWYDLPKATTPSDGNKEGPLGDQSLRVKRFWRTITSADGHAAPIFYWIIGIVLSLVTVLEVVLFTAPVTRSSFITIMLVLSLAKFVLVIAFFMHLRFDNKQYTRVFMFCMIIGLAVFTSLLFLTQNIGFGNP